MAKKDVDIYFRQICEDYHELIETLHEMEEEVNKGMLDPDKLEQLKKTIEPMKINWQRISYIMFLLNKPTRKQKVNKYEKQNIKMFHDNSTLNAVHEENMNCLNQIKNITRTS